MQIKLISEVNEEFDVVAQGFDEKLFRYLLPPSFIARLVEFGGSAPGDKVHIRFFIPWPAEWVSRITESYSSAEKMTFTDIGEKLPFGMKSWKHIHTVEMSSLQSARIIDHMHYSFGNKLIDMIMYPVLYFAFAPRKKLYRKYFKNRKSPNN
ncbi:MAG: hypothetical protein ACLFPE_06685 [Bacteroidales bacterium]